MTYRRSPDADRRLTAAIDELDQLLADALTADRPAPRSAGLDVEVLAELHRVLSACRTADGDVVLLAELLDPTEDDEAEDERLLAESLADLDDTRRLSAQLARIEADVADLLDTPRQAGNPPPVSP